MANLGKKDGIDHIRFRYLGREFKKSLKVRDQAAAEAAKNLVELTIHRLVTGQIVVPEAVEAGDFIFSGGTLLKPAAVLPTPKPAPKTIIEMKGEAGYCLAPPSPAACHKTGKCYTFLGDRDLTDVPTISTDERDILIACAVCFDAWQDPPKPQHVRRQIPRQDGAMRPGDDFNLRADWADILGPHGWTPARGSGASDRWRRRGKDNGVSATGCRFLVSRKLNDFCGVRQCRPRMNGLTGQEQVNSIFRKRLDRAVLSMIHAEEI